jgi:hypothetical protein
MVASRKNFLLTEMVICKKSGESASAMHVTSKKYAV